MGLYEAVKDTANLLRKIDDHELHRSVANLQLEAAEATNREATLTQRVAELENLLDVRASLEFRDNMYWMPQKEGSEKGPYCQPCWDSAARLVFLCTGYAYSKYSCLVCKNGF